MRSVPGAIATGSSLLTRLDAHANATRSLSLPVLTSQSLQRLSISELDNVPVGIAHHREVTHHAARVQRLLNQYVLLPGAPGEAIDFGARVALEPKVIETGFHFILHD